MFNRSSVMITFRLIALVAVCLLLNGGTVFVQNSPIPGQFVILPSGVGSGTVTSVVCGTGMTGGTITTTGTCNVAASLPSTTSVNGTIIPASVTITRTVFAGTKALATSAISSAACTSAQTLTATGTLTTDTIQATFNGDPTGLTGFLPVTTGALTVFIYPTADTINIKECNMTSSSITPSAATLNLAVTR